MRDSMVELTGSVDEDESNRNVYAFSQISGNFSEKYQSTPGCDGYDMFTSQVLSARRVLATEGRVQRESSPSESCLGCTSAVLAGRLQSCSLRETEAWIRNSQPACPPLRRERRRKELAEAQV